MFKVIRKKQAGLKDSLVSFDKRLTNLNPRQIRVNNFTDLILSEMKNLDFDRVSVDPVGNVIGRIEGYGNKEDLVLISHLDLNSVSTSGFKSGVSASIYAGAVLKRALLPLKGNLIICCVPRTECCDFGIQYLFQHSLKKRISKIRGVVLCEPTALNIALGHRGKMEYEIVIKGKLGSDFFTQPGINMLGSMFPLIHKLEKVSQTLPHDCTLGDSSLRVKDVKYSELPEQKKLNEFRVVVDRDFVPQESIPGILRRAKTIAQGVYKDLPSIAVSTAVATEKVRATSGCEITPKKEFKPWKMESHHPFVLSSRQALADGGFKSSFTYWKKIFTEGSYTYGNLNIPTIGFGAGKEDLKQGPCVQDLDKAVYGYTLIVARNIGIPTFGWSADEI